MCGPSHAVAKPQPEPLALLRAAERREAAKHVCGSCCRTVPPRNISEAQPAAGASRSVLLPLCSGVEPCHIRFSFEGTRVTLRTYSAMLRGLGVAAATNEHMLMCTASSYEVAPSSAHA